jgi:tetratricopeptide (TPR) repeat protein
MQPFTAELAAQLKPPAEPLRIRDRSYGVELDGQKAWVTEDGPDGEKKYAVAHALGGKNVLYFLTPLERGRLQVLPLAFDVRRQEWFDTAGSAARGILNLRDEVLDWRAPQLTFNTSCYGCHVSQFSANYVAQTDTYHSVWAEPGINCETCHAPGGEHVKLFQDLPPGEKVDDLRIIRTKGFSIEQSNALCAPCHAKMIALTASFRPGDRYFDNYDLVTPEHTDFYPDGRDLGENYTYTSWRLSACVQSGQLSCLHCHTSSGRYRYAESPNHACFPCHREHVENPAEHTHHVPESTGSQCVACHMPITEFARMRRSDHSMRPPMPAATLAFKSPNACNLCHADQDAAWADGYVRQWRSRDYQAPVLRVAGLVDAARKQDWTRLPDILAYLSAPGRSEIFTTALIRLIRPCEDARKWPALLAALKDPSPLVRASAAEALDGYLTADGAAALLVSTQDEFRVVRVRAAAALAALPRDDLTETARHDLERATGEFLAVVRARPDDTAAHHNQGNYYMERREYDRAILCYERAFQLLPDQAAPLVNASLAHNAVGHDDQAEDCLRRALKVDPTSVAANLNLALLLGERGRLGEAEAAFRAVLKSEPRSATAAYNLGVLLARDRPDESLAWCRTAAQLRPQEPKYAYTLAFYLQQRGDTAEAIGTLQPQVARDTASVDVYVLLGQLYEQERRSADAAQVYGRAAASVRFSEAVRTQFAARAARLSGAQ